MVYLCTFFFISAFRLKLLILQEIYKYYRDNLIYAG